SGLDFPINTFSCTVGLKLSQANYYIKSSLAAAALCKELSQVKEKEEFSNLEEYEEASGVHHLQYAVANPAAAAADPRQSRSAGDIANLAIVMSSQ
ncbi:unnamed protein product, partial [Sphacelaria rigidula]